MCDNPVAPSRGFAVLFWNSNKQNGLKCGRQSCTVLPWLQTSNSGRREQRVVDTKQEEKQHLPRLSGHAGGVTGEFLHCRQHLLTQLEVHRAEVLRPARHTHNR